MGTTLLPWLRVLVCTLLALAAHAAESQPTPTPAAQPAFPEKSAVPAKGGKVRSVHPRNRIQRRVREPMVIPSNGTRPASPAPTLPERMGGLRAPSPKGIAPGEGRSGGLAVPSVDNDPPPFAPFGRLLKCELVFSVDSLALHSPIIALVREDVAWDGEVIVPAGTEVFGRAVPNRIHNRIGDDGTWTLVLPDVNGDVAGREWVLKAHALDRAEIEVDDQGRGRAWTVSDGAPGLHGYVIDEADRERIELFAATALAGAVTGLSRGLQTRVSLNRRGTETTEATLRNAGLEAAGEGGRQALELLAKQILVEVEKNGAYVRVPAGKTFYLFVEQTLDPRQAEVGLHRMPDPSKTPP